MKSKYKILLICVILLIILTILFVIFFRKDNIQEESDDKFTKMHAVVVKVSDTSMQVMEIGDVYSLITTSYGKNGNIGFKQGQEVLIYWDGFIFQLGPSISNVEKIEIIKEKSDIPIPEDILKSCYNVSVSISEFTNTKIALDIVDHNELPYEYFDEYSILKYNEITQSGLSQEIKKELEKESSNLVLSEYIVSDEIKPTVEEVKRISNIPVKNTVTSFENSNRNKFSKICDWTNIYGPLKEREISIYS